MARILNHFRRQSVGRHSKKIEDSRRPGCLISMWRVASGVALTIGSPTLAKRGVLSRWLNCGGRAAFRLRLIGSPTQIRTAKSSVGIATHARQNA